MTDEVYDRIKKSFRAFAMTVEYWALVWAVNASNPIQVSFAEGFMSGCANTMIDLHLVPEAFLFVDAAKEKARKKVANENQNN